MNHHVSFAASAESREALRKRLTLLAFTIVLCTLVINLLSAYIRHLEAGLDCEPWPQCYALIGSYLEVEGSREITRQALTPSLWVKQTHRAVATLLVALIFVLLHQGRRLGSIAGVNQNLPYYMVAVLLVLSVVGPASYLKTLPAIAVVNFMGGALLMGLAFWYGLQLQGCPKLSLSLKEKYLVRGSLYFLLLQLALGIWVSGNFAGLACAELASCEMLAPGSAPAFWYFRELQLSDSGRVLQFDSANLVTMVHRAAALLLTVWLVITVVALRVQAALRPLAMAAAGLVLAQLLLGLAAVYFSLPLWVVLAHSLGSALLLLALVKLNFRVAQRVLPPR